MFSSISKAWNEVNEEVDQSVKFSPSTREPSARRTLHYIHHDTIKNPIERIRNRSQTSAIQRLGSPHVLKPITGKRMNKGSFWKKVGKLGKSLIGASGDSEELKDMKGYTDGMVKKRRRGDSIVTGSVDDLNLKVLKKQRLSLRDRIASVNERAEKFTVEVPGAQLSKSTVKRLEESDFYSSDVSNGNISKLIRQRETFQPLRRSAEHKLAMDNLPSSPYQEQRSTQTPRVSITPFMESTPKEDITFETIQELKSQVDSFRSKVEDLETTVESLKHELHKASERSILLEHSLERHHGVLPSEGKDMSRLSTPELDIPRLSPVKLDLGKFNKSC